ALYKAVESGEDFSDRGASDLQPRGVTDKDVVVGIAASGRTPYTIGALNCAREIGALTIAVTCNPGSPITKAVDISIVPATGPVAIAGSTRMKAGTAQKMVPNLLSTGAMVKLGYVYDNLMSNVQPINEKLRHRAAVILSEDSGLTVDDATVLLKKANNNLRAAMIMHKTGVDYAMALDALSKNRNIIRAAIETITKKRH